MKKLVALVIGTRPEAIKMAPVYFSLCASPKLEPIVISTGQHRQMLDQTLRVFGIAPKHNLNLMQSGQTLPELTARVITSVSSVLAELRPAAILLQGDTTTVLGAALAAFYQQVPIGHIEAGLRTYNYAAPWPEEMNRRLTDPISQWCFAPTDWSAENLRKECINQDRIFVTGNTVIDALLWMKRKLRDSQISPLEFARKNNIPSDFAERYLSNDRPTEKWILVTGHRRESFGQGFDNICKSIASLAKKYPDLGILYPVHLNPNVQEPVRRILSHNRRIALIPPLSYENFIYIMDRCNFVLSDSGGVQEEAPSLGKPVLVMRTTTERPEGVAAGTCLLVGTDPSIIVREASRLLDEPLEYARRSALQNPYGDGTAASRIVRILEKDLT